MMMGRRGNNGGKGGKRRQFEGENANRNLSKRIVEGVTGGAGGPCPTHDGECRTVVDSELPGAWS